jgi:P27 family predicted phage terminase small subunit
VVATPSNSEIAPSTLDVAGKALWAVTLRQLKAQGSWSPSDAPLLARYVGAIQVGRLARERIAASVKALGDDAYTTIGSQGQLVQHPDLRTARDSEHDANSYAVDLLLTPRARSQHNVRLPPVGATRLRVILGDAG